MESALAQIQTVKNINSLGELTEEEFEEVKNVITDPIVRKEQNMLFMKTNAFKVVVL